MKKIKYKTTISFCFIALQLTGCYTAQLSTKEEFILYESRPGIQLITTDHKTFAFKEKSYIIINDSIIGRGSLILENKAEVERDVERRISMDDVEIYEVEQLDGTKTILFIAGSAGLGVILGVIINNIMKQITSDVAGGVRKGLAGIF